MTDRNIEQRKGKIKDQGIRCDVWKKGERKKEISREISIEHGAWQAYGTGSRSTYAGAKGCRAVAAAAAASGPGFLARANAAALVGKAALAAPTRPLWMATPLSAAAATTRTKAHANARLPFQHRSHAVGEFPPPPCRPLPLRCSPSFLAFLFREISWGRGGFPERKRGRRRRRDEVSFSKKLWLFFPFRGVFEFWREERTPRTKFDQFFFSYLLVYIFVFLLYFAERIEVSKGREDERQVSLLPSVISSRKRMNFRKREGENIPILFSFAEEFYVLRQCFSRWDVEFQNVERARKEGSFNDLDLEGLESSQHVGGDVCIFYTLATIIVALILFNLLSAFRKDSKKRRLRVERNNGTRMKAWDPHVFCEK